MRSEYSVREVYTGDAIQTDFTFDFKVVNPDHLLVVLVDEYGDELWKKRGTDTSSFSTTLNEDGSGGSIIWPIAPDEDYTIILLLADDQPKQESKYTADSKYTMKKIEASFDALSGQIQRIRYLLDRSIRLPEKWVGAFNTEAPEVIAESVPMISADRTAITFVTRSEFKGDKGDPGGLESDDKADSVVESIVDMSSPSGFKPEWSAAIAFTGFTERFNEIIDVKGIYNVMAYIMKMGYVTPNVVLSGLPGNGNREVGNTVSSIALSALVTKTLEDIAEVRFYQGVTLLDTQTSGGGIPTGGTSTHNYATPFSTTTSFSVQVDDVSAEAKPSKTSTLTYTFLYPYFTGKGGAAVTPATIYTTFTKIINTTPGTVTASFSFSIGEKPYFAYPATFADLTSIKNVNNLETIGSWTKRTENMTNAYGQTVSYKIYEFNNLAGEANNNTYTFIR